MPGIAPFPSDRIVGMHLGGGEVAAYADTGALRGDRHAVDLFLEAPIGSLGR